LGTYSREEHEVFALLFLPFLLVASAMVLHQSLRTIERHLTAIAVPDQEVLPLAPEWTQDVRLASAPQMPAHAAPPLHTDLAAIRTAPEPLVVAGTGQALAAAPFGIDATAVAAAVIEPRPMRERTGAMPAPLSAAPVSAAATPAREETELALLGPVGGPGRSLAPRTPDPIETLEAGENGKPIRTGVCSVPEPRPTVSEALSLGQTLRPTDPSAFGLSLAKAAESQVGGLVIYNDAYRNISYPMGDVNRLFGVCTDVVVRAYRTLGLDLQALVHEARAGTGDTSIDHRRTEILRRFFAARGESLPVTTFPEDYRPGDIVTYHRPQNRGARAHIAIVSSVVAPSGRPMIVHNRGWGPELEDALFVDQITGHYRYRGPAETRNAGGNGRGAPAWAVTVPVRPAAYATERHGPEAR
jgi:uncharacterized protein YijF (DUF1287 family)